VHSPPREDRHRTRLLPWAALLAAGALLVACGGGDGRMGAPPRALAYARNPVAGTVGVALPPDAPAWEGGAPSAWSVSPTLPANLALDSTTGVVSGTPAAASPAATYTVTATNDAGSASVGLVVAVEPGLAPPAHLRYSPSFAVLALDAPMVPSAPASDGGPVAAYSVSPVLPAGLSLDPVTGVISGTPAALAPEAVYEVTAANAAGASTFTLRLVVLTPGAVWLAPASVTCVTRASVAFTAAVVGLPEATLAWSATAGAIDGGGHLEAPRTPGTVTVTAARPEEPAAFGTAAVDVVARTSGNVSIGLLEPAGSEVALGALQVSAVVISRYWLDRVEADLDGVTIPLDLDEEARWSGALDVSGWPEGPHLLRVAGIDVQVAETEVFREIALVHPP